MRLEHLPVFAFALRIRPARSSGVRQPSWITRVVAPVLCGMILCSGCANLQEKKTITAFQSGLEAGDLDSLREKSSENFTRRALRHQQADESLKQLKIPDGKFEILTVEEVSKTEKKVTLGFGEDYKRKVMYRLVKDENGKSWKVDDIYMRQRAGDKQVAMAVTEQMDVLLSSREFFEAWNNGDRSLVLAKSGPDLSRELEKLPPAVLAHTISKVVGHSERTRAFRPDAMISGDEAVVKLNRSHGTIAMTMENVETGWRVKDLSLDTRSEEQGITSLLQQAQIANQAFEFLTAWQQSDKPKLQQVTNDRFYKGAVAPANLQDVPLPDPLQIAGNIEVKRLETHADVVLRDEGRTIRLTLNTNASLERPFEVADVTIYKAENNQTISLSSAMTARPIAELFLEALHQRDTKMLQYSSTLDLQKRVWGRMSPETLKILPLPIEQLDQFELTDTRHAGHVTQVIARTGAQQLTIILHDQSGKVVVDDVLVKSLETPGELDSAPGSSLKTQLAAIAPVYELAASIHQNTPQTTLRLVTDDFYDRVFSLATTMPESGYTFLGFVTEKPPVVKNVEKQEDPKTKPNRISANLISAQQPGADRHQPNPGEVLVEFHQPNGSLQVLLKDEQGLLRIDDAVMFSPDNQIVMRFKQSMRMELASTRTKNMIRTVSGEVRTPPGVSIPGDSLPGATGQHPSQPAVIGRTATRQKPASSRPTSPPLLTQTPGAAELPESMMQNALYEEFQDSPRNQIHQTGGQQTPVLAAHPEHRPTPALLNPPAQLQPAGNHLLLKPVPTE